MATEKMREALEWLADEMRSELTDDGASLPQWLVKSWLTRCTKALAEQPAKGEAVALKGIGKITGDGWKDTTTVGQVVFVWNAELPEPYAAGQFPRIGHPVWSASVDQFDFFPASADELREFVERRIALAAPPAPAVPEELTPKQIASACFSLRHDYGLLPERERDLLAYQCREWWRAISKELNVPSQHPMVLASAPDVPK